MHMWMQFSSGPLKWSRGFVTHFSKHLQVTVANSSWTLANAICCFICRISSFESTSDTRSMPLSLSLSFLSHSPSYYHCPYLRRPYLTGIYICIAHGSNRCRKCFIIYLNNQFIQRQLCNTELAPNCLLPWSEWCGCCCKCRCCCHVMSGSSWLILRLLLRKGLP